MAVASSCEAANRFQLRLSVPRSPALQPMVGGDRSWWTFLPANAVSELMMVPIGLQLELCPPQGEGHIPPVIFGSLLQHLPEKAVCCGTRAAERFQSEAEFLNPFEGSENDEVAVLKYIDAWSRMTSTEQLEYASSLVGRVLVQTASQEAFATHTSWRPWLQTTSRRKASAWDQYSQALQHAWTRPHMRNQLRAPRR